MQKLGEDTRAKILDAALWTIAESGVDGASIQRVAQVAALSTGPLYSRFDGVDDLVVALWEDRLRDRLDQLLEAVANWMSSEGGDPNPFLAAELVEPSLETVALLETLSAVRRYPYAVEVVETDFMTSYRGFVERIAPIPVAVGSYAFSVLIGDLLLRPILRNDARSDPLRLLQIVWDLGHESGSLPSVDSDLPDPVLSVPSISIDDQAGSDFLNAALTVISRAGFEHASASRIGREADQPISLAYRQFTSKRDIVLSALDAIVDQIAGTSAVAFIGLDRHTYQQAVLSAARAHKSDTARILRRVRLESLLAARHHPEIGSSLSLAFDGAETKVRRRLVDSAKSPGPVELNRAPTMWHLVRAASFGIIVLQEMAGVITDPEADFSSLAMALPAVYDRHVATPLGIAF